MTPTARPWQAEPITATAYSRQEIIENRYLRSRSGHAQRNTISAPTYHEGNSKSYRRRIDTLLGYASEEGIVARNESKKDFNLFVDTVIPTNKAMLIIMDNGHLRATWKEDLSRLSLEFIGGRLVHYVVFVPADPYGQPFERSGECSFDEIRAFVKLWELWSMVTT